MFSFWAVRGIIAMNASGAFILMSAYHIQLRQLWLLARDQSALLVTGTLNADRPR
jgi:hypothetical protein